MGSSKGSAWEREFAVMLSLWWSEGKEDDLFWRVLGSGGRATNRGKKGKSTAGGYGDITATDHRGQALLNLCCFELKRGYNSATVQDLLDKPKNATYASFLDQTKRAASLAGVPYWCLVHKRDRRHALVLTNVKVRPDTCCILTDDWHPIKLMRLKDWLCIETLNFFRSLNHENRS
jgi:hypothetical protein